MIKKMGGIKINDSRMCLIGINVEFLTVEIIKFDRTIIVYVPTVGLSTWKKECNKVGGSGTRQNDCYFSKLIQCRVSNGGT